MKITTPTGKGIRIIDSWGSGLFGAPRGSGAHIGLDFMCEPGKPGVASITPIQVKRSNPYPNYPEYGGLALTGEIFIVELWYIEAFDWVFEPDARIKQGWEIGICQDIRNKVSRSTGEPFGDKMIPHLHMQVRLRPELLLPEAQVNINPEVLM